MGELVFYRSEDRFFAFDIRMHQNEFYQFSLANTVAKQIRKLSISKRSVYCKDLFNRTSDFYYILGGSFFIAS